VTLTTRLAPLRVPQQNRTLANGLRVVVHEDHTSPIVAVHLMYHAGSKDERPGRTGLAHLLEHLLFEGSENCPKGEFDRLLERAGGTNNGSTWLDRTNYYEVVPSHAVELALWLERERMAHFLPVLDEAMLEVQRGVVMNERRQSCDNRPYGLADERLHELLFPAPHPYSWPTIGYMRDLEEMTLQDARGFFERFYTPRNAVLVLAGDLAPERGFELAERYFGDLAAGPGLEGRVAAAPTPDAGPKRTNTMEDRVSLPRVYRAWAVPPYGTDAWVALDVLTYLLSDGESSRLQRRLVRELQIALDVDAYLYPTELEGVLGVVSTARSGAEGVRMEEEIERVIREVAEGGVDADEVAGAVRRARRDQLSSLANVEERAEELAYATTVLGAPEALEEVLDRYAEVGPEEVQAAARAHLAGDVGASVVVVPRPGEVEE
jgi:zinc protease